jgi:hypothetical protein
MANCFIPELAKIRRERKGISDENDLVLDDSDWVVYWMDGYSSHLTMHTSKLCDLNKILLYCFKAHSSHICQPNDLGPFKPLKAEWKIAVSEWRVEHPYAILSRVEFAAVLSLAVNKLNHEAIISGYRVAGLFPFNAEAVHYERLTDIGRRRYRNIGDTASASVQDEKEIALRCIESYVGAEVVSRYNELLGTSVINADQLPPINAYFIWHFLKTGISLETTESQTFGIEYDDFNLMTELVEEEAMETIVELETTQFSNFVAQLVAANSDQQIQPTPSVACTEIQTETVVEMPDVVVEDQQRADSVIGMFTSF